MRSNVPSLDESLEDFTQKKCIAAKKYLWRHEVFIFMDCSLLPVGRLSKLFETVTETTMSKTVPVYKYNNTNNMNKYVCRVLDFCQFYVDFHFVTETMHTDRLVAAAPLFVAKQNKTAFCVGDQLWDARGLERQARLEPGNHNAGGCKNSAVAEVTASDDDDDDDDALVQTQFPSGSVQLVALSALASSVMKYVFEIKRKHAATCLVHPSRTKRCTLLF
ncbi:hypothetical protein F2P81_007202 [Scophthalmus maximus]|uniref:Uncharacterized protein n=1 Tax=Scophthalmus maximus TaxID=52904 RepID=A0A6A4TDN7_SCOMX|nr:hypothetical protein F2P81_007202 [Scophthalmus maximus]